MPAVILCDRGVMDGSAYVDEQAWQALLDEAGWNPIQLRDKRYEAVIHLVTAADGAEEFYGGETNEARYEGAEDAKERDKKLINSWIGHPHFKVIDNRNGKSFKEKIQEFNETVYKIIGIPTASSFFKKYLLKKGNYEL
jgi:hypothetical protein